VAGELFNLYFDWNSCFYCFAACGFVFLDFEENKQTTKHINLHLFNFSWKWRLKMREFDYYIFIDFSDDIIGYNIIGKQEIKKLLPKISRFRHYRNVRNKKIYLKNIKKTIKRENIKSYFLKSGIKKMYKNTEIYTDVLEFLKKHSNCIVFISVDDRQFKAFNRLVGFVDGKNVFVKKESELVKGTPEYQTSLVLDSLLNIERCKK